MLRTVWRVRTHEVLEQGVLIVHRAARGYGQAPYSRTSVTTQDLSRQFGACQSKGLWDFKPAAGLVTK